MNPPTQPTVLILGARGRLGNAAVRAFARAGWHVLAQVRAGAAHPPATPAVRWLPIAPGDTRRLAEAARGAAVVLHALSPAYRHDAWRRDVPALARAAIDVSRALGATLLVPGNVYNFGAGMPPQLHEDTPQRPTTFKGRMRVAIEQQVEAATRDGRLRAVVLRAGDFFGSGVGSWLDRVIAPALHHGRMTYPGPADVPTAWAWLPDLARAFVRVAELRDALPAFAQLHFAGYSLTGDQWREELQAIARGQGWIGPREPLRVRRLPWPLLQALGWAVPTMASLAEMRYLWRTPHALVNTRLAALAGPEPQTPFPLALRQALDELGLMQHKVDGAAAVLS